MIEAKYCYGEEANNARTGNTDVDYYNRLKERYTNCTYVQNNVIIRSMGSLNNEQYPLGFLKDIKEVVGHIYVKGPLPLGLKKLPFNSLMIIRGDQLARYSDNSEEKYSLLLYNNNEITHLNLNSLRGRCQRC